MLSTKHFVFTAAVGLVLVTLGGCTTPMRPEGTRKLADEHVVTRSYKIGSAKTVTVGEPMVKVEDYWLEVSERPVAIADKSFTLSGGPVSLQYLGGKEYPVRGRIDHDGASYAVVPNTDNPSTYQAALVDVEGKPFSRVVTTGPQLYGDHVMVVYTMKTEPPDAKLLRQRATNVVSTKGFINYELLYTGSNASGINLTYREFSPEGLARVAFFQNLTYPADARSITFKQLRIRVERASADGITFTVTEDGADRATP
ncbi:MAG: hypothetical protein WA159_17935 [Variovorax sp.]